VTRSRTRASTVNDHDTLHEVAIALVRTLFPLRAGIRLIGVTLSTFDQAGEDAQLDLLSQSHSE